MAAPVPFGGAFCGLWGVRNATTASLSGGNGGDHPFDSDDVERPAQIVDERGQAELSAHLFEAAHQERALVHPLFDRAERVFDRLAATVENSRPRLQASGHAVQRVFVFETRNGAIAGVRAARPQRTISARLLVGVVDLRHFAQLAKPERLQFVTARTNIGVVLPVVDELVLAKEPVARRRSALGTRHIGRQPGFLASRDVLGSEVAFVRDDVDPVATEDFAGRLGGRLQQAHVDDLVRHFLFDDQLVLRVDRELNVVADSDAGVRRHGAAVGIGQRYLVLARAFEVLQHGGIFAALLAQGFDFLREIFHPRAARRLFRRVPLVEALEVIRQPFVGGLEESLQRIAGEVAILVVDRLDPRAVHGQQFSAEQIEPLAQQREGAKHRLERGAIVGAEIGDGLEVWLQRPQQPDDLDVAMAFGFQPPARPHAVEITVDVKLEQIARLVTRSAGRLRLDTPEPCLGEIETVNEGVDKPDGIVGADVIVNGLRQKQELRAFETGNMRHTIF